METLIDLLKQCDYFGVGLTFKYKYNKRYKSICGGIVFILFVITSITYSLIKIIQFIINRPITVIYYKKELPKTDVYSFSELKNGLAFKATCEDIDTNIYDIDKLFTTSMVYCRTERINGQRVKTRVNIPLKSCQYNDFYNRVNESMDLDEVTGNYLCPQINNLNLSGAYVDTLFEYFEVTLNLSDDNYNETVTNLLYENECKLSYYFNDYAIDVNNKSNPVRIYLNQNFIQLSPVEYRKVNLFFNIIELTSYENYLFNKAIHKKYGAHSKSETYELFKGNDRFIRKSSEYGYYAKIYIRVDSSRIYFERRYQQIDTLFANVSSPLSVLLMFLYIIMTYLNNIFVINSVIKTIYRTRQEDFDRKQKFRETFKKNMSNQIHGNLNFEKKESKKTIKTIRSQQQVNNDTSEVKIYDIMPRLRKFGRNATLMESAAIDRKVPKIKKLINKLILNSICKFFPCSKNMNWEFKITSGLTKSFYEQMDIYNYLKHLQMIKIISYITLDRNEFYLVRHLSNPSISWGNKDFYQLTTDKMANIDDKINDFWNIFEKLLNKKKKSNRERKICKLICSDINNILEK